MVNVIVCALILIIALAATFMRMLWNKVRVMGKVINMQRQIMEEQARLIRMHNIEPITDGEGKRDAQ